MGVLGVPSDVGGLSVNDSAGGRVSRVEPGQGLSRTAPGRLQIFDEDSDDEASSHLVKVFVDCVWYVPLSGALLGAHHLHPKDLHIFSNLCPMATRHKHPPIKSI